MRLAKEIPDSDIWGWMEVCWVDHKSQSTQLKLTEWTDWITDYFNLNQRHGRQES